ncbi:hypothetical protein DOTSEDRAFT_36616 [Dothistroma septosporum NZE10]|uniref:Uncharacterized protein n=1 Tax=Dothistroma septosporum (strain NZE10 / CBS 128990) TaxID=675120 RepID=N1PHZ5_DOTSN|nr:hypothetical protein DOTSEDRAFT_36616 [Dothistroma septosporum NZE10]
MASTNGEHVQQADSPSRQTNTNDNFAGDPDGSTHLGDKILQRIDSALSSTVIDDIKHSHDETKFSKGSIVFELTAMLHEFVDTIKKSDKIAREKDKAETAKQAPSISNVAVRAMVNAAVEEQVAKRVGDLQIENGRLRKEVQGLKNRMPIEIEGGKKAKTTKLATEDDFKDVNRQVKTLETQLKRYKEENTTLKDKFATLQTEDQKSLNTLETAQAEARLVHDRSALDRRVTGLSYEVSFLERRLDAHERDHNSVASRMDAIESQPPPPPHICSLPATLHTVLSRVQALEQHPPRSQTSDLQSRISDLETDLATDKNESYEYIDEVTNDLDSSLKSHVQSRISRLNNNLSNRIEQGEARIDDLNANDEFDNRRYLHNSNRLRTIERRFGIREPPFPN